MNRDGVASPFKKHVHTADIVTPTAILCRCGNSEKRWYPDRCEPCKTKLYSPDHTCPLATEMAYLANPALKTMAHWHSRLL